MRAAPHGQPDHRGGFRLRLRRAPTGPTAPGGIPGGGIRPGPRRLPVQRHHRDHRQRRHIDDVVHHRPEAGLTQPAAAGDLSLHAGKRPGLRPGRVLLPAGTGHAGPAAGGGCQFATGGAGGLRPGLQLHCVRGVPAGSTRRVPGASRPDRGGHIDRAGHYRGAVSHRINGQDTHRLGPAAATADLHPPADQLPAARQRPRRGADTGRDYPHLCRQFPVRNRGHESRPGGAGLRHAG